MTMWALTAEPADRGGVDGVQDTLWLSVRNMMAIVQGEVRIALQTGLTPYITIGGAISIQMPMPTIATLSISEIIPNGTLLLPPTQAHFNSRFSM